MEYASTGFYPRFRNTCVITVTSYTDKLMRGYLYSPQLERSIPFENLMRVFRLLGGLMNHANLPQRTMELRMFPTEEDARALRERPMPSGHRNTLASFSVTVLFRQNASWQGNVIWNERQMESHFRSALELASLMDGALSQVLREDSVL